MADDDRIPCKVCGRKFAPEPLSRHQKICKNAQKPRKVFDSSKQRATDDLSVKQIKQAQKKDVKVPKNHWREKHQDFINAVRSSKGVTRALETGGPLPPPPPPSINPDYVQCPYCSRRFNEKAASRHIDFCKEQSMRLPKGKADPAAKAKQQTRLTYQAPRPKAKTASQPTTPVGRGVASGRGGAGGPAPRAGAPRGRTTGVPAAGRYNTQDDDFSPFGQGVDTNLTHSTYDTPSPVSSHRSGYSQNSYSNRQHNNLPGNSNNSSSRLQQHSRTQNASKLSSTSTASHQKKTPSRMKTNPTRHTTAPMPDDDNGYSSYLDSYRDNPTGGSHGHHHTDKQLNKFPDHFNKRYKTNPNAESPVQSYTKNKPPTHFQYLNSVENDDAGGIYDDEDMYLYSNNTSNTPPASLYGRSSSKPSSTNHQRENQKGHHGGYSSESGTQSGSKTKPLLSYCQECGAKYPVAEAKFCCECGSRRPRR